MSKTIEESIKEIILNRYGNLNNFCIEADIPNSTLNSIFKRGILNCTISKIIKLANILNISIDGLVESKIEPKPYNKFSSDSDKVIDDLLELKQIYYSINTEGKNLLMTQARLIIKSKEYKCLHKKESNHAQGM